MQFFSRRLITSLIAGTALTLASVAPRHAVADDPPQLPTRPGKKNINIWPPKKDGAERKPYSRLSIDGWVYTATKNYDPSSGVPWALTVTPSVENPQGWIRGDNHTGLPSVLDPVASRYRPQPVSRGGSSQSNKSPEDLTLPVIKLPETLWRKRFSSQFSSVVGIHFHEFVSDDYARILYSLHKVPPDGPDGKPPANYKGASGTRIEATLLTPLIWSIDQSVVVRDDVLTIPDKSRRETINQARVAHEKGHAEVSRKVLIPGLAGPQDWNTKYCTGRRCNLTWYWRREIIGRSWDGYQRGVGKLKTLRTSVAIVPPTRWSKLVPIPPERITQRHIDEFNREIVDIGPLLSSLDQQAQDDFHATHGAFEGTEFP